MPKTAFEIIQQVIEKDDGESVYGQQKTLFLITHMRAYSTLLSRILGSNPGVDGFLETHRSYHDIKDVVALRKDVRYALNAPLGKGYVLDKLTHNNLYIGDEFCSREDIVQLLMLRNPIDTVNSLYQTSSRYGWSSTLESSLEYYIDRLKWLATYTKNGQRLLYIDAESLIDDTTATLTWLTEVLGLREPLAQEYTYIDTARGAPKSSGDPSEYLKKGKIVREREPHTVKLEESDEKMLWAAYNKTRAVMLKRCQHMY